MSDPMHSSSPQGAGPITQSVDRLRREFEKWVEAALQQGNRALDVVGLRPVDRQWAPAVDLVETPAEIHIDVDLPGVEPAVVDVSLAGNILTIQGPKKLSLTSEGSITHLAERMQGPFQRMIPLPASVIPDSVTADLKNGVLRLRLLKSEKARLQKIPVHSEPAPARTQAPLPTI
jgi:HSP20 family protein